MDDHAGTEFIVVWPIFFGGIKSVLAYTQRPTPEDNGGAALKKAGVRYRRPYQTRHTFASMLLSAGEHPMWVAQQMGHSDWTMIAQVYGCQTRMKVQALRQN